ncbi:MAG: 4-hydroxy-3-methylbut-2-enyl diphosphate reductase [Proteobacteria bacterium]|nr:4-hydroxy-3-methylbut-2-enyl diphosphate reductase [Pseudomonadota bacterium]
MSLKVLLCGPRGFCAGVVRAVAMVEACLVKFGAPVFVRHEIVHNKYVVEGLRAKGVVFVKELDEIPDSAVREGRPVLFSAHGVSKAVVAEGVRRGFMVMDATCPLVHKVHTSASALHKQGHKIMMVGHAGHPEVKGTMGQLPDGESILVQDVAEAEGLVLPVGWEELPLALATQTTLSVDETAEIIAVLQRRFPRLKLPRKEDICYATTNRQAAVKVVAPLVELMIVVGAPYSSNSVRLRETALQAGCPQAVLVQRAAELAVVDFVGVEAVGVTSAASAPEELVEEVLDFLRGKFGEVTVEEKVVVAEDMFFAMPQELRV